MAQSGIDELEQLTKRNASGLNHWLTVGLSSSPLATRSGRTGALPVLMMFPW